MNEKSFEEAFSDRTGSCRSECACGKVFYNPDTSWDWEDGELEALRADKDATAVEWAVGQISFEGQTFVRECDCWKARSKRVMNFLDAHMRKIAEYYKQEKDRKLKEAEAVPSI